MAPEMEDGRQPNVGFEADVYSLGKMLYYILSNGKIFAREKYRDWKWRLSKLMGDPRLDLFNTVFDNSITIDRLHRYTNAREFQKGFRQSFSKFRSHPQTTIIKKFSSINNALQASEKELRSLSEEEWIELLSEAKKIDAGFSQNLLSAACDSLSPKFAKLFAEALLDNELQIDSSFITTGAARILCLPQVDVWFSLWLRPERFSRLAMHALNNADINVLNAVSKWDSLTLQHCDDVIKRLAENFHCLHSEAKQNFLIASMKSSYLHKDKLLLELSYDEKLDILSLEAVVAGLCAYASKETLARVSELADRKDKDDKFEAIMRGIVQGSSPENILQLSKYEWNSDVVKVLLDVMNRTYKDETENNNSMERNDV